MWRQVLPSPNERSELPSLELSGSSSSGIPLRDMGVPLPSRGRWCLPDRMGRVPLEEVHPTSVEWSSRVSAGPSSVGAGCPTGADVKEKAADPAARDGAGTASGCCAEDMRSSSSPSLSRLAEGSSVVSSSCGRLTPCRAGSLLSATRSLNTSSGAGWSPCSGCEDECEEPNGDTELDGAWRVNDPSRPRDGDGWTEDDRDMLRPLVL